MSNLISKIRKKLALKLPSYKLPEVSRGPKEWYVSYSYLSPFTRKYEGFKVNLREGVIRISKQDAERARKYWKLVVQKGLGIMKKIYALKHSGRIRNV
jgi:hypothetical protein